jgi:hypothetical protein
VTGHINGEVVAPCYVALILSGRLEGMMNVYRKLVADLLVGDYHQVVSHVPNEDQRPECFRRVEKIEYIEAPADQFFSNRQYTFASGLPPQAGAVVVWCHGVSAPLIYPPGDVTVWADVPEERRESDGEAGWWGSLLEGKPLFPSSRVPTDVEVELAELEDIKDRMDAEAMWET